MKILNRIFWTISHAYERKVRQPRRARLWLRKKAPFEHRTTGGLLFKLHPDEYIDRFIFIEGIYESRFLNLVRAYFKRAKARAALDIGSNIGNHALYLSGCFQEIHCFDPNPLVIERLTENIKLNRLGSIFVHPVGLSNRQCELAFVVNRDGDLGSSHFVEEPDEETIRLPVAIGDDYLSNVDLQTIDFIKIDVENHEPEVFEGLRRTIARDRPIIAFEYHGGRVSLSHFERIAAVLPGYVFAEAQYMPAAASLWRKLQWHFTQEGRPILVRFDRPVARTYENILAFPDKLTFKQFRDA